MYGTDSDAPAGSEEHPTGRANPTGVGGREKRPTTTPREDKEFTPEVDDKPRNAGRNRPAREEDAPEPEPPAESMIVDCPKGYEFGKDLDTKSGCSKCPDAVYEACRKCKRGK